MLVSLIFLLPPFEKPIILQKHNRNKNYFEGNNEFLRKLKNILRKAQKLKRFTTSLVVWLKFEQFSKNKYFFIFYMLILNEKLKQDC